jgi:hypothetical protein
VAQRQQTRYPYLTTYSSTTCTILNKCFLISFSLCLLFKVYFLHLLTLNIGQVLQVNVASLDQKINVHSEVICVVAKVKESSYRKLFSAGECTICASIFILTLNVPS